MFDFSAFSPCMMVTIAMVHGAAMVARVDTITSMVEGLLGTLRTSCELIWGFNTLRQGAGLSG